ncbi:MAG: cytochrome c [Salinimicrobium sp.]
MRKILFIFLIFPILSCRLGSKNVNSEAVSGKELSAETKQSISRGAQLYNNFCASCHLSGGEGINGIFPPLKNSQWLTEERKKVIHTVKYGLQGPITVNGEKYDNLMTPLGLTDAEVTDVLNYVFKSWGNNVHPLVTEEEVAAIEK